MKAILNHAALTVDDYDYYTHFFEEICGMHSYQTRGQAPDRQTWYTEGIQLIECAKALPARSVFDHICLDCLDVSGLVAAALEAGCTPIEGKPHWFTLPNGAKIEVKNYH